jgi:phosphoribosylaminoimidazole-succinocarboxamide synthase
VILADEISPDTCRLWDSVTDKKLDKDRFRKNLGDLIPAYTEVAKDWVFFMSNQMFLQ